MKSRTDAHLYEGTIVMITWRAFAKNQYISDKNKYKVRRKINEQTTAHTQHTHCHSQSLRVAVLLLLLLHRLKTGSELFTNDIRIFITGFDLCFGAARTEAAAFRSHIDLYTQTDRQSDK